MLGPVLGESSVDDKTVPQEDKRMSSLHINLLEILCFQNHVHCLLVLEAIIPNMSQLTLGKNKVPY